MNVDFRDEFLGLTPPEGQRVCNEVLSAGESGCTWGNYQRSYLEITDDYLARELEKPVEDNIDNHEAGGQWRIAFPQLQVRGNIPGVRSRIMETMRARRKSTSLRFFHGFPDCAEVHHEIETFIYFQLPLYYSGISGCDEALISIEDVAHHAGNWVGGVPDWYDWEGRRFLSMWLGTKEVRDYPPYDYQEANHFRFIDVVLAAYMGTKKQRYLDLAVSYAETWCDHIEGCADRGEPIRCSILPSGVDAAEMGKSGKRSDGDLDQYLIFYGTVSTNTGYDIVMALQDIYSVTGENRFLNAGRLMTDQFFENQAGGRPSSQFSAGQWKHFQAPAELSRYSYLGDAQGVSFLSHMALRYDMISGDDRYRSHILGWAHAIDEEHIQSDQMSADLLAAAHYYDGDARWLARAYAMTLRTAAVLEPLDMYNQCGGANRQASRYLMQHLYLPLTGGCDWGTRGNMPITGFRHWRQANEGLPVDVAFRCWRGEYGGLKFEAVNLSEKPTAWEIAGSASSAPIEMALSPKGITTGTIADSACE